MGSPSHISAWFSTGGLVHEGEGTASVFQIQSVLPPTMLAPAHNLDGLGGTGAGDGGDGPTTPVVHWPPSTQPSAEVQPDFK